MKTNYIYKSRPLLSAVQNKIAAFVLLLLVTAGANTSIAQTHMLGAGCEFMSTGNSHGGFSSPYLSITKNWNQFTIGAMIQNRTSKLNGLRLTYIRSLSGASQQKDEAHYMPGDHSILQINFLSYLQYNHNANLSLSEISNDQKIFKESGINYSTATLSTAEGGVGIEFRIKINQSISWRNMIGAGCYYHTNYFHFLDTEKVATSLLLSTAIQFNF